jgi:hypothetical protein
MSLYKILRSSSYMVLMIVIISFFKPCFATDSAAVVPLGANQVIKQSSVIATGYKRVPRTNNKYYKLTIIPKKHIPCGKGTTAYVSAIIYNAAMGEVWAWLYNWDTKQFQETSTSTYNTASWDAANKQYYIGLYFSAKDTYPDTCGNFGVSYVLYCN